MKILQPLLRPFLLVAIATAALVASAAGAGSAQAAVSCPNANPVVNENNCMGPGSTGWMLTNYNADGITGYATQGSVNLGSSVTLRIAVPSGNGKAEVNVYRMGWYGGLGGRLVYTAKSVAVTNGRNCMTPNEETGYWSCGNWENTLTVPGSSLPASGIYLAHIKDLSNNQDNTIIFTVRDDSRHSELLYKLPDGTYQAYNSFNGHSLYRYNSAGFKTVTGTSKAVQVSFERPYANDYTESNWFLKADFPMVQWLEKEGYEVDYTDDPSVDANPGQLLNHKTLVISGHDEYWSENEMNGYKAARAAGVNIASFSGNTAYWKVRYEANDRTLVCFKTVEGYKAGEVPDGSKGVNDWGPDMKKGTADDAVGKDGIAGTADDNPQNSTTTWRDNGAPPGDPNAPPEGRVGPDQPENSLLGSMYVGDNDNFNYPLTIPATNEAGEFAGSRVWRNTGISKTSSTTIGSNLYGWEWDSIPTQAQYLSREPAGVKRVTQADVGGGASPPEWLQDEGLMYAFAPPPGQPTTVSAVEYTAPSGAHVFHAGTIQWSWGLAPHFLNKPSGETYEDPPTDSSDPRIQQATYNILADGGVEPGTPTGVVVDGNEPPTASFTVSPNPTATGTPVTFDASASKDPDGTIAKYEWDLDGNGSYETSTGTTPTVTKTFSSAGEISVHLRVTDNSGASEEAVRVVKISNGSGGNIFPTAAFTISPNPVTPGAQVTLNASGSSDPDGTIAKYEWDLDGNGTYETSTGTNPSVTTSYATAGNRTVGLRVTDNGGGTGTTTRTVIVGAGSPYSSEILATPGLIDYWRLGDPVGSTTFGDSKGSRPATAKGGVTLGVPGAIETDANTAASFDGASGAASVPVDLSGGSQATIEFWMNWSAYANNDALAFEFTNNFNNENGGFLVDPNAGELGGKFGVAIGREGSRNNAYFTRPSAGVWHHYAFVLNSAAPAAEQVIPYVDGQPIAYEKLNSGTGAGNFANSTLYFMSRAANSLFGKGNLDEVALYNRALTPAEIAAHYQSSSSNQAPSASFTVSASPVSVGTQVNFDASASKDPDGTIAKYEWDLDGNGTYETSTGSTATVSKSYAAPGTYQVGLRVTDNGGATATTTRTVVVGGGLPTASFTATPGVVSAGGQVSFDGSASKDPDGTITKYEWDLDGNGSYETNTGSTPTVNKAYAEAGSYKVGLRVTDNSGNTATSTQTVTVNGQYASTIAATPGLLDYWRLGDGPGTTFADAVGSQPATAQGGVTFGATGAIASEPDTSASFDGTSGAASVPLDLSGTSQLTLEFWMNWSAYANNDALAFEFTPNFNSNGGGFLIDPNAGELGGKFGVAIGREGSRNNVYFPRPSAGSWHHYTFVFNTQAAAGEQITPYVDGKPVSFEKLNSGTGAGNFANSTLYFMSRAANSLFGKGNLDEVALYNRALSATEVENHYLARSAHNPPSAVLTANPNPAATGSPVTFDGSGSVASGGTITKYEWDLDGNGTYETNTGSTPTASKTFAKGGEYTVGLRVTDDQGATGTTTKTVTIQDRAPVASFTTSPASGAVGTPVSFDGSGSSDPDGTITKYEWDLDGNGSYETDTGSSPSASKTYAKAGEYTVGLRVTDDDGVTATTTRTVTVGGAYYGAVTQTPGVADYWRLGERSGPAFADSVGTNNAAIAGGVTLGTPGALGADPDTAATFDGGSGSASAPLDLSGTSAVTLEFWLKWTAYQNNDQLAFEYTPNFNANEGGFLVDPNAGELGGKFGVAIGREGSRNNAYFARPSAGVWHHYALVLNSAAPASEQVIPYVDGQPVAYEKLNSGTGAGNFAKSTLYFMSRAGTALFGKGSLDEVSLYGRALSPAEIAAHYAANEAPAPNQVPVATLSTTPTAPAAGQAVKLDASASTDGDGTIDKYEWDLDGDGTYETSTGTSPTTSKTFTEAGEYKVGVRVTDNEGATATATQTVTVHGGLPHAALSVSPSPAPSGTTVTFDASGSTVPNGTPTYEWDLDGNGSYETNTGSTPTVTKTFAKSGSYTVGVRVTDGAANSDTASATAVVGNRAPTAALTTTPATPASGQTVTLNASGSSDLDGTIAKYEWDLDGNGTYETEGGTSPTITTTFPKAGTYPVGVRVTDNEGATATATQNVTVHGSLPVAKVTVSPASAPSGTTVTFDASGSSDADGPLTYEWDLDNNGTYETSTGSTAKVTKAFAKAGSYTVGLRVKDTDSTTATATATAVVTNRAPSAALTVTPTTAATGTQLTFNASASKDPDGTIAKYEWDLDGNGTYETTTTTPTTTAAIAAPGSFKVGVRVVDDEGATATASQTVTATNRAPTASFTLTPNPVPTGTPVAIDASASADPDGKIVKYEWDLDGNGTYETSTTTPTTTKTFTTSGAVTIRLRVTDNSGATGTATQTLTVQNRPPVAAFTFTPDPATRNQTVTFSAAGSSDPDGTIAKYEWDLDGNGTYETSSTTSSKATRTYTTVSSPTVSLRVTDNKGATTTISQVVSIRSAYNAAVLGTSGLLDYWRLGETSGTSLADVIGGHPATTAGSPTLGGTGAIASDPDKSISFDGSNDTATVPLNLSSYTALTVEFWLKWPSYANDGKLAFEFTPSSASNAGSFFVEPNSPERGGRFGVGLGGIFSRNNAYFTRPSANVWHHYAIVFNTKATGSQQVIPYVDGSAVSYVKEDSGTGAGAFANSTLYFMSRAASSRFGKGNLDEVAIYNRALTATEVLNHYRAASQ
jgi:YD repeat-containing protein